MRGFLRFLLVPLCAEWLITFRIWGFQEQAPENVR
jgi:hypothetical protein